MLPLLECGGDRWFVMVRRSLLVLLLVVVTVVLVGCRTTPAPSVSGVVVEPGEASVAPGAWVALEAVLAGLPDTAVAWSASGGSVSGSGLAVTFVAPVEPGSYVVTARSVSRPEVFGTAEVRVIENTASVMIPVAEVPHARPEDLIVFSPLTERRFDGGSGSQEFLLPLDRAALVGVFDERRGFGWTALWPSWFEVDVVSLAAGGVARLDVHEDFNPLSTAVQMLIMHPGLFHPEVEVHRQMTEVLRHLPEVRALADALFDAVDGDADAVGFDPFGDDPVVMAAYETAVDAAIPALDALAPAAVAALGVERLHRPLVARGVLHELDLQLTRLEGYGDGGLGAAWSPDVDQLRRGVSWIGRAYEVDASVYESWAQLEGLWSESDDAAWRTDIALTGRVPGSFYLGADPLWAWMDLASLVVDTMLPSDARDRTIALPNHDALYAVHLYSCSYGLNLDLRNTLNDARLITGWPGALDGWAEACFVNDIESVFEMLAVVFDLEPLTKWVIESSRAGLRGALDIEKRYTLEMLTAGEPEQFLAARRELLNDVLDIFLEGVARPGVKVATSYLLENANPKLALWTRFTAAAKFGARMRATRVISPWEGAVVQVGQPFHDSPEMVSVVGPTPSALRLESDVAGAYLHGSFEIGAAGSVPLEFWTSFVPPPWMVSFTGVRGTSASDADELEPGETRRVEIMAQCPRDGSDLHDEVLLTIENNSFTGPIVVPISISCSYFDRPFPVPPQIMSFEANPEVVSGTAVPVDFSWSFFELLDPPYTCALDVTGDGDAEYTISECTSEDFRRHHYAEPGTYEARLTVSNAAGEDSAVVTVVVGDGPVDPVGTLEVTVRNVDGVPRSGVSVTLDGPGGSFPGVSGAGGVARFEDVPVGSYEARVWLRYASDEYPLRDEFWGSASVEVEAESTSEADFTRDMPWGGGGLTFASEVDVGTEVLMSSDVVNPDERRVRLRVIVDRSDCVEPGCSGPAGAAGASSTSDRLSVGVTPSGVGTYRFYLALETDVDGEWLVTDQLDGFQFSFESLAADDPGQLGITINGLPSSVNANVRVTGPNDYDRTISSTTTLTLPPGTYTITASNVSSGGTTYAPTPSSQQLTVSSNTSSNATITYAASLVPVDVWFNIGGKGSVRVANLDPCTADCTRYVPPGEPVSIVATADTGFQFTGWADACEHAGANTTCTITPTEYTRVIANFAQRTITINYTRQGTGSGTLTATFDSKQETCNDSCSIGPVGVPTVVTLQASPASGHTFEGWAGACADAGTNALCMLSLLADDGNQSVSARFGFTENRPPTIDEVWLRDQSGERFECGSIIPHEYIGFHWRSSDPDGDTVTHQYRVDNGRWRDRSGTSVNLWLDDKPPGTLRTLHVRAIDSHDNMSAATSCTASVSVPPEILDFDGPTDALGYRVGETVAFAVNVRDVDNHYPSEVFVRIRSGGTNVAFLPMDLMFDQGADNRLTYVAAFQFTVAGSYEYRIAVVDALGVMMDGTDYVGFTIFP